MADVSGDIRLAIFGVATLFLGYISRASLLRPKSHGFYRFFVFEIIVLLVLINVPRWFIDPFSWHQIVSWILLMSAFIPLILGVRALRLHGRPDASTRPETELLAFERTSRLVREGIFRFIRHPMYSSLLLLAWGIFFKVLSGTGVALAILATAGLMLMAKIEEAECMLVFGQEYREYMRHTRRFIPYVL